MNAPPALPVCGVVGRERIIVAMRRACLSLIVGAFAVATLAQTETPDMSGERYLDLSKQKEQGYLQLFANYYPTRYEFRVGMRIRDDFNKRAPGANVSNGVADDAAWCDEKLSSLSPPDVSMNKLMQGFIEQQYGPPPGAK